MYGHEKVQETQLDYREEGAVCGTTQVEAPYSEEIHRKISNLHELARAIKNKSQTLSGARPQVSNLEDRKDQEPFNFSEAIVRDINHLTDIMNEIYNDLERFV